MSKRNVNIRKSCDMLKGLILCALEEMVIQKRPERAVRCLLATQKVLHSIKRTTWRGKEKKVTKSRIKPNVSY